jgi:hypothetical protein
MVKRASPIDWPWTARLSALLAFDGVCMSALSERDKEAVRHERAIRSLHDRTGAPLPEVRRLFAHEFSRLELGAKARSYLSVLTVSNVRAMLRRKGA